MGAKSRFDFSRLIKVAVAAAILSLVLGRWDNETGLTYLIRFGENFAEQRLPALKGLALVTVPGAGYDGQFYAQLAVDPRISSPEVQHALDNPSYRARRILMPLVAHVLGAGRPWMVLHAYAMLNVAAWVLFAVFWWKEVELINTQYPLALWCAGVLGSGALTSLRFALTDLPSVLFLLLAVRASRKPGAITSALYVAAACLARETSALAAFIPTSDQPLRRWTVRALALTPLVLWLGWLTLQIKSGTAGVAGNFDWPGFAFIRQFQRNLVELSRGTLDSRYLFGVLGGLAMAYQSVHVILHWKETTNPWIRAGLPFALLFWVLGDFVWAGYWAVARVCLPMTLTFNLTLRPGRWLPLQILAGNIAVLHSVYRMLP